MGYIYIRIVYSSIYECVHRQHFVKPGENCYNANMPMHQTYCVTIVDYIATKRLSREAYNISLILIFAVFESLKIN